MYAAVVSSPALVLLPIFMMFGTGLTVDEALDILERRVVSGREYRLACEAIETGCAEGDERCVRRLVEIWSDPWSQAVTMELACKKADDKTLPLILDAVKAAMAQKDNEQVQMRVSDFFFRPAQLLCARLTDPEPVLKFAVDNGRFFHSYPVAPALKNKYALQVLRRATHDDGADGVVAAPGEEALPELRALLREMVRQYPRSAAVWTAIDRLAEWGDTEIIPDLEALLVAPPFPAEKWKPYEARVQTYLVKLRLQGQPDEASELLRIARSEREHSRLLSYAVWRLLYLKTDRQAVLEALESDRQCNGAGHDITQALRIQLAPGPLAPVGTEAYTTEGLTRAVVNEYNVNTSIFDRQQQQAYHRDLAAMHAATDVLTAEEDAIRQRGRLAVEEAGDDEAKQRELWQEWERNNPDKVKRLAEIAEGKKRVYTDYLYKYSLKAILEGAPLAARTPAAP